MSMTLQADSKLCRSCGIEMRFSEFYRMTASSDGLQSSCKVCQTTKIREYEAAHPGAKARWSRTSRLKREYGITDAQYAEMVEAQSGGCAVCGDDQGDGQSEKLHVDHDHATGEVRGLLCGRCNKALGLLKDNVKIINALATYLEAS